jgi:hypothetical protein
VAEILATVADRFSLEITFRDCKEIVGAGQQQVRFVWANIGAFHICLWTFTMTEAWAWLGPGGDRLGGPQRVTVGRSGPAPEPRRQTSGVASLITGGRDSRGSSPEFGAVSLGGRKKGTDRMTDGAKKGSSGTTVRKFDRRKLLCIN